MRTGGAVRSCTDSRAMVLLQDSMLHPLFIDELCNPCHAGASGALTSGQVATLDVLVKEMLGRSDWPISIGDVMHRCAEKKLALSEAAVTQVHLFTRYS